ncbi:MAG: IPT/TIG domain-containing protein [Thermoanaerobaculia bacterium]
MQSLMSASRVHVRLLVLLLALPFIFACKSGQLAIPKITSVPYTIDHELHGPGELTPVSLEHGDKLDITIVNTKRSCYLYNLTEDRPKDLERSGDDTVAELSISHDEATIAYIVNVTLRPAKAGETACADPGARQWRIPVRARWNLSASGGFAGHGLTSPVFYLAPAERDKPGSTTTPKEKEQGFIVRRNRDAEDEHVIAGAALLNLYMSARGIKGITWAPLTFGLSVDQNRNDYLLGTSAKFGNRAYLTIGRVFGSVGRLRDGFVVDQTFTTDQNALGSSPTRRADAWFISMHFSFLDQGISNLFKTKLGVPVPGQQEPKPTDTSKKPTPDPTSGEPGTPVKVKPPTGQDFGAPAETSTVKFGSVSTTSKDMGDKWKPTEISIITPDLPPGSVNIVVTNNGTAFEPAAFQIKASNKLKVNPTAAKIGMPIKVSPPPGANFGGTSATSSITIGGKTITSTDIPAIWKSDGFEIAVPAGASTGPTKLVVVKDGAEVGSADFEVQP